VRLTPPLSRGHEFPVGRFESVNSVWFPMAAVGCSVAVQNNQFVSICNSAKSLKTECNPLSTLELLHLGTGYAFLLEYDQSFLGSAL
jgi:hypothetical protein